ncbi:MAG: AAA family ATPase [Oscillospiraceae bacterium]|jgi:uncharacterized protein YhaN|nr:AAA family ATPase [Oscillospiraceae bacterium]
MRIIEIYIKNFGKLSDFKIIPGNGVNIIFGENESGKSTVMAFFKSMLYGLGKGDARKKYLPWSGAVASGILTLECDGKLYSLSRVFGTTKALDKVELWCKTTGEQVSLSDKTEPGEFLLGINEMSFVNSVFIGQLSPEITGSNDEILARMLNLASTGDESASRTEIEGRLTEASAGIHSKRANAILPKLEAERSKLLEERLVVVDKIKAVETLRNEIAEITAERADLSGKIEKLGEIESVIVSRKRLAELEKLKEAKSSLDATEAKFRQIDETMYGDGQSVDGEFIDKLRELLEGCNAQDNVIKVKSEQLSSSVSKLDSVDRSKKHMWKIIREHEDKITLSLEDFEELEQEKHELERALEERKNDSLESQIKPSSIIIATLVTMAVFILLGIVVPSVIFYILAAVVGIGVGVYFYMSMSGKIAKPQFPEEEKLADVHDEIRNLNRSSRWILDDVGVPSLAALRTEVDNMNRTADLMVTNTERKETLTKELEELQTEFEALKENLLSLLRPFFEDVTYAKAVSIITRLDKLQREHAVLKVRLEAEQSAFALALGERDYDALLTEEEELRASAESQPQLPDMELSAVDGKKKELEALLEDASTKLTKKETELEIGGTNPQDVEVYNEKIKLLKARITHYEFEYDALQEAISALGEAFETMQRDFGPIINFKAGKILDQLTGGKYPSVFVSERLIPSVSESPTSSNIRSCASLSLGTNDQIYLAMRLAIATILSEEPLPVLLDDAFAQYDDKRLLDALFFISKESGTEIGQAMIFTCHKRVAEAAAEIGVTNAVIQM